MYIYNIYTHISTYVYAYIHTYTHTHKHSHTHTHTHTQRERERVRACLNHSMRQRRNAYRHLKGRLNAPRDEQQHALHMLQALFKCQLLYFCTHKASKASKASSTPRNTLCSSMQAPLQCQPVYFCTSKASKASSTPRNTLCSSTADEKAACDQGGIVRTPPLYVRLATFLRLGFAAPPPPCSSSNVSICTVIPVTQVVFELLYQCRKASKLSTCSSSDACCASRFVFLFFLLYFFLFY
jgi:hypothetical protein